MELGPLVKIISHDLRGPLGNMKNVSDLFKIGEIQMDQAKMFMVHIEQGVDRSLKLLDDLLEWSLASSEDKKVTQEVLDINDIISEVFDFAREKAAQKNQNLVYDKRDLPQVYFDKGALKMILKNLVVNAIHFTQNEGEIKIMVAEANKYLHVSVIDNGMGIPEKMHATIFEMGKDNRRLGTNEEKGTGIGLFMCKDLVKRNKGMIWIESSKEGEGSTIMFSVNKATKPSQLKE